MDGLDDKTVKYPTNHILRETDDIMDFETEVKTLQPDYFVVNEDGYSPAKESLCHKLGIELKVLERIPEIGLPRRSTTDIRTSDNCLLPYRIDLAGTWIDQPYVSKYHPGWAIM